MIANFAILLGQHSLGLVKAEWAPDGRTVLCFSEWGVSATATEVGLQSLTACTVTGHCMVPDYRNRHVYTVPCASRQRFIKLHNILPIASFFIQDTHSVPMADTSSSLRGTNQKTLWAYMTLLTLINWLGYAMRLVDIHLTLTLLSTFHCRPHLCPPLPWRQQGII